MDIDHQEFKASIETRGVLYPGRLVFGYQGLGFKNTKTGKTIQIAPTDWEKITWIRIAGGFGLKLFLRNGQMYRFAGFKENDFETVNKIVKKNYQMELAEENKSIRGWNWGSVKFNGSVMELAIERQTGFALPLSYVSQCTTAKNEAILEFHPNDESAVSLMEMRFYIPQEGAEGDPLESFHQNVISKADIIQATGDALLSLNEVPCLTPRGRYELKVYPTFLQLHGKTFDYKIPYNSVLRIFILPHSDGRQMFFVLSLDPPIKQGQTRYPFLILNFKKDEDPIEVDLEISEQELKEKYDSRLEKHVSGQTYEVLGRVMKGLVNRKITVPGSFKGVTGNSALTCSYKAAAGFLYPLDRGFIYVHKPAIHIRFDEVSSVNFARSGGNTRSFDFEIETKNQILHTFSGIPKEEYQRLFDFISSKGLRVKNRGEREEVSQRKNLEELFDSDEEAEHDPYMEQVKKEGKERDQDEDEEDEDFKPPSETSDVAEEFDSDAESSSNDGEDEEESSSKKKHKEKKKDKKRRADDDESSKPKKARKEKGSKKVKDPDMPKRPQTAYFLFMNEMRDKIKSDNPGIALPDIGKKAAEMWKALSDKKKWEKRADELKEKYNEDMKEYRKNQTDRDDAGDRAKTSKPKPSKSDSKKKTSSSAAKASPVKAVKSKEYIDSEDDSSSSSDDAKEKKNDSDDSD